MSFVKFAVVAGAAALLAGPAGASNLLINGGFETGDFTGWTVTDQAGGSGAWFLTGNGATTVLNDLPQPVLAGGGAFIASTDQVARGSHTLSQTFSGVAGAHYMLSFDARANDQSGVGPLGLGTDYANVPNQHVQVTVQGAGEDLIYYGVLTPDWRRYDFDISGAIAADGLYTLSFSEVDNQYFLNEGLDNVSLFAGAPEPAAWALMLLGFGGLGATLRRRRAAIA